MMSDIVVRLRSLEVNDADVDEAAKEIETLRAALVHPSDGYVTSVERENATLHADLKEVRALVWVLFADLETKEVRVGHVEAQLANARGLLREKPSWLTS